MANDAEHLARVGSWPRAGESPESLLALAFYRHGELLKKYSVLDLVPDPAKFERSVSHYRWLRRIDWNGSGYSNELRVETVDDSVVVFDIRTGERVPKPPVVPN